MLRLFATVISTSPCSSLAGLDCVGTAGYTSACSCIRIPLISLMKESTLWILPQVFIDLLLIFNFCQGQYLLADSAYKLPKTVVPAYKSPASNIRLNLDFNYCLAKSRVQNKHTIGVLKAWWGSLREMQLHLYWRSDMREFVVWLYCCIIIHTILSRLEDQWNNDHNKISSLDLMGAEFNTKPNDSTKTFWDQLTQTCASF